MPARPRLFYWDSCVFIDYIKKSPERIKTLDAIVEEARQGKCKIVASTFSVAEVVFGEGEENPNPLDPQQLLAIRDMWRDRSIINVVEFHMVLAEAARDLVREGRDKLRPLDPEDAIHLATARDQSVDEFHTYDGKLLKWTNIWFPIKHPAPIALQLMLPTT